MVGKGLAQMLRQLFKVRRHIRAIGAIRDAGDRIGLRAVVDHACIRMALLPPARRVGIDARHQQDLRINRDDAPAERIERQPVLDLFRFSPAGRRGKGDEIDARIARQSHLAVERALWPADARMDTAIHAIHAGRDLLSRRATHAEGAAIGPALGKSQPAHGMQVIVRPPLALCRRTQRDRDAALRKIERTDRVVGASRPD